MALAKPVMGTKVPAPAYLASRWYQPNPVVKTERKMRVTEHQAPASSRPRPRLRQHWVRACPTTQMSPPTTKAIGRLRPLRVGGELSLSILSYSLGVIAIIIAPFPAFADIMGRSGGFIRVFNFQGTVGGRFPLKADPQIAR